MNLQITIPKIFGRELRLHWSWLLLPIAVGAFSLATLRSWQAGFYVFLLLAVYSIVLIHEATRLLIARKLGLKTRTTTIYPFWGVRRCDEMSDRPWQETTLAKVGVAVLALVAALLASGVTLAGYRVTFPPQLTAPTAEAFCMYLFWAAVGLIALHLLPFLPLDGGRYLHAVIAQRTSRLRATEIVAVISTVGVGIMVFVAFVWMSSPFLAVVAILIFLAAQSELDVTRRFERLRVDDDRPAMSPTMFVVMDSIVTADCRPKEADFSGFTWNPQARLWIEWRHGRAVAANAVLGDSPP